MNKISFFTPLVFFCFCSVVLADPVATPSKFTLSEEDQTQTWKFPYLATPEKTKRIMDGIKLFLSDTKDNSAGRFIEIFGKPDVVTDLHASFPGLSMKEDGMLMENRQFLSFRMVWYLKRKSSGSPNLNDVWVAAYVGNGSDKIIKILRNQIELK